jgi:hypothetical protein
MNKDELFELLKENLTLRLSEKYDYGGKGIEVQLWFDNEKLCSDYVFTSTWQD